MQLTEKQKAEGWRIVKFGKIAKSVSKRVDPADTELEVYVGLEHLDPNSLRIARRGVSSDVKGQKLLVKPGQIIFGKRRAYQRKVVVADFEGICSAHAMVLEAISEVVIPEYLPFFMQSNMFMECAVAISEGSLSPTIKWKTLANQEFPLAPRDRQEQIIKLMRQFDETIKLSEDNVKEANKAFNVAISKFAVIEDIAECPLTSIGSFYGGLTGKKGDDFKNGNKFFVPYVNVFNNFSINTNNLQSVKIAENEKQNKVAQGDVIFTISSETPDAVGMSSVLTEANKVDLYLNSFCVGFRPNGNKLKAKFSKYFFRSAYFRKKVVALAQGSTRFNISRIALGKIQIALPDIERQMYIASILEGFEEAFTLSRLKDISIKQAKLKVLTEIIK